MTLHVSGVVQLINFLSCTPVTAHNIRTWTDNKDPVLSKVWHYVLSGWPTTNTDPSLQPYWSRCTELSVLDNCIIWCSCLVAPPPAHRPLLEQFHESHPGASWMKSLAHRYLWWPSMDTDIENFVKQCLTCQSVRPHPPQEKIVAFTMYCLLYDEHCEYVHYCKFYKTSTSNGNCNVNFTLLLFTIVE